MLPCKNISQCKLFIKSVLGKNQQFLYWLHTLKAINESIEAKRLAETYDFNGYKRIYHYHIRKTAGTTLNHRFHALGGADGVKIHKKLLSKPNKRIILSGKVFVAWNLYLIQQGNYFYAHSHFPMHMLKVPPQTFTVSCFRNPLDRIVSHYKMLIGDQYGKGGPISIEHEKKWLGSSFVDFVRNMPKHHMLRQLYMFSEHYDVDEAFERVTALNYFFFMDEFEETLVNLALLLGLPLQSGCLSNKSQASYKPSESELELLREQLVPEINLYDRLLAYKAAQGV